MYSKEFLYLYLAIFGLIICLQIFDIIKLIFKKLKLQINTSLEYYF